MFLIDYDNQSKISNEHEEKYQSVVLVIRVAEIRVAENMVAENGVVKIYLIYFTPTYL